MTKRINTHNESNPVCYDQIEILSTTTDYPDALPGALAASQLLFTDRTTLSGGSDTILAEHLIWGAKQKKIEKIEDASNFNIGHLNWGDRPKMAAKMAEQLNDTVTGLDMGLLEWGAKQKKTERLDSIDISSSISMSGVRGGVDPTGTKYEYISGINIDNNRDNSAWTNGIAHSFMVVKGLIKLIRNHPQNGKAKDAQHKTISTSGKYPYDCFVEEYGEENASQRLLSAVDKAERAGLIIEHGERNTKEYWLEATMNGVNYSDTKTVTEVLSKFV